MLASTASPCIPSLRKSARTRSDQGNCSATKCQTSFAAPFATAGSSRDKPQCLPRPPRPAFRACANRRAPDRIRVIARQRSAKLLLPRLSQLLDPVGISLNACLDRLALHSELAQIGAHPLRPLAARRAKGHEVLEKAAIIQQFLGAQPLDQLGHNGRIVAPGRADFGGVITTT